eukprot:NODE_7861_length_1544_cov_2.121383.p2 GENE.NODE_7861_length_1544_cov_2.121383~~NODE_7861_length_1544_cov_2.121383.p2  ORF type:complete len:323 (-),score=107.86 NODE_7861_length_1544_cov_2.121383:574-1542(-)
MEAAWGFRLAAENAGLGRRAIYRAASHHCCVDDRSYMEVLGLEGPPAAIADVLELCGVNRRLTLSRAVNSGARRGRALLRESSSTASAVAAAGAGAGSAAAGALIAPVHFLWQPAEEPAPQRRLWMWVHPSAVLDAAASLERAAAAVAGPSAAHVRLRPLPGIALLELTGPLSLEVLARAIPPEACRSGPAAALWHEIAAAATGTGIVLPAGAALALDVDVRALLACATPKQAAATTRVATEGALSPQRAGARPWLARWPDNAVAAAAGFWHEVVRQPEPATAMDLAAGGVGGAMSPLSEGRTHALVVFRRGDAQDRARRRR